VESAVVKDASGNVVELKNLRPDGSIGEPEDAAAEVEPDVEVEPEVDAAEAEVESVEAGTDAEDETVEPADEKTEA
jgi:trigger factor